MADEDHAFSLIGKSAEDVHDLLLSLSVKISRRLICKDYIGIIGERTGDRHSLLLSSRKLQHSAVCFVLVKSNAFKNDFQEITFWQSQNLAFDLFMNVNGENGVSYILFQK